MNEPPVCFYEAKDKEKKKGNLVTFLYLNGIGRDRVFH